MSTVGDIIEKAMLAGAEEAARKITVRRLHSPELQRFIEDAVKKCIEEIVVEPAFKDAVRARMIEALEVKP